MGGGTRGPARGDWAESIYPHYGDVLTRACQNYLDLIGAGAPLPRWTAPADVGTKAQGCCWRRCWRCRSVLHGDAPTIEPRAAALATRAGQHRSAGTRQPGHPCRLFGRIMLRRAALYRWC